MLDSLNARKGQLEQDMLPLVRLINMDKNLCREKGTGNETASQKSGRPKNATLSSRVTAISAVRKSIKMPMVGTMKKMQEND